MNIVQRLFFFALVLVACNKTLATTSIDARPTVLEPMEAPTPPKPSASVPMPGPASWALSYTDDMDLPMEAGTGRCADAGTREIVVKLELTHSGKSVSLVIPELRYKKQLWDPNHKDPASCDASRTQSGAALRFFCGDDLTSTAGKVYTRGSDVVLGVNSFDGKRQEVIPLPCGSKARFEAPVAPTPAPSR